MTQRSTASIDIRSHAADSRRLVVLTTGVAIAPRSSIPWSLKGVRPIPFSLGTGTEARLPSDTTSDFHRCSIPSFLSVVPVSPHHRAHGLGEDTDWGRFSWRLSR